MKYVFLFSLQMLCETCLHARRIQRDVINVVGSEIAWYFVQVKEKGWCLDLRCSLEHITHNLTIQDKKAGLQYVRNKTGTEWAIYIRNWF